MSKRLLSNEDFCRAAKRLRCDVAAIKAVAEVESRGAGFYANGFPTILFERHVFRKYTEGKYNRSHPHLSGPAGNYGKAGQNQRNKFNEAYALDPVAAIKACSWGKFQVMGFNWKVAGYSSVIDFFEAMQRDEGEHLNAFIGFVIGNRLDDEIRNHDWAGFAYGYNGAGYKKNNYHTAMARAYKKFAQENIDCSKVASTSSAAASSDEAVQPPAGTEQAQVGSPNADEGQSNSNEQPPIKEQVVVEKEERIKLWDYLKLKFGALTGGNIALETLQSWLQQWQSLGLTGQVKATITTIAIVASIALIIIWIVSWWREERSKRHNTELLVNANATADNIVHLAASDSLSAWQDAGATIVKRK